MPVLPLQPLLHALSDRRLVPLPDDVPRLADDDVHLKRGFHPGQPSSFMIGDSRQITLFTALIGEYEWYGPSYPCES